MILDSQQLENLRRGTAHFRTGDYFAAHDDWEEVWQGLRGRQRTFWQAMIQLVVGAYHLNRGNRKGCDSLWRKALGKCHDLAQTYEGDIPEPLSLLTDLLYTCLYAQQQGEEPWSDLSHFANAVLCEEWFALQ